MHRRDFDFVGSMAALAAYLFPLESQFEKLLMHQAALRSHFMYINIQIIPPNQIIKVNFAYDVVVLY